jgi:hypothetical protein
MSGQRLSKRHPLIALAALLNPATAGSEMSKTDLNEPILEDDYKVYGDYFYVADGKVIRSDVFGTVRDLKRNTGANEIRRCDMVRRGLFDE